MKRKATIILLCVSVFLLCVLCGCGKASYTVTFDLNGGELVSGDLEQSVVEGSGATAPEAVNGRKALSWDKDFSNITEDTTVTAVWTKVAMNTTDLAEYVQKRTVTVNVNDVHGGTAAGSGFFIDDQGTLVTNYHVIDAASTISVEVGGGGTYNVLQVVDFNPVYDLAILKADVTGNDYLELCEEGVRTGEQVFAVGSALGTLSGSFTAGTVSSTSRMIGQIECIQMDAAISHGNSGGPLVNVYGEVVGVNSFSYVNGDSLNLAIKLSMLDKLARDKNWSVNSYTEWYNKEAARSYSPLDGNNFYFSLINTYQNVTGGECLYSVITSDLTGGDAKVEEGYVDCYEYYVYEYNTSKYDEYVEYIKSLGFEYQRDESFSNGVSSYYYNDKDDIQVDLFKTSNGQYLYVWIRTGDWVDWS